MVDLQVMITGMMTRSPTIITVAELTPGVVSLAVLVVHEVTTTGTEAMAALSTSAASKRAITNVLASAIRKGA